jgi:hypothetical protein
MKYLTVILILTYSVFGQTKKEEIPACYQPFSYKFDEFRYSQIDKAKEQLKEFAEKLIQTEAYQGIFIVYSGKKTFGRTAGLFGSQAVAFLRSEYNFEILKVIDEEGGFREEPTIELFVKPLSCSEDPKPTPTLEIEDVEFNELDSLPKDALVKSTTELMNINTVRVEPIRTVYAKAFDALGKVACLVIIDEKGKVIKVSPFYGNFDLYGSTIIALKQWEFVPTKIKKKAVKVAGIIILDYKKPEERLEDKEK